MLVLSRCHHQLTRYMLVICLGFDGGQGQIGKVTGKKEPFVAEVLLQDLELPIVPRIVIVILIDPKAVCTLKSI